MPSVGIRISRNHFISLSISPLHFFNLLADTMVGILFLPISSRDIYHMMWNIPSPRTWNIPRPRMWNLPHHMT